MLTAPHQIDSVAVPTLQMEKHGEETELLGVHSFGDSRDLHPWAQSPLGTTMVPTDH